MMDVMEDREVWRLNLKLLLLQSSVESESEKWAMLQSEKWAMQKEKTSINK